MYVKKNYIKWAILFTFCCTLASGVKSASAENTTNFSFAVIGDIHYYGERTDDPRDVWDWPDWYSWIFPQMLDELAGMKPKPAFVVVVGDFVSGYPSDMRMRCTGERFDSQYQQLISVLNKHLDPNIGFVPVVGNHDYHRDITTGRLIDSGPMKFAEYMIPRISMPAKPKNSPYYSFDFKNSHFVILCTGLLGSKYVNDFNDLVYGQQYKWLANDLAAAAVNPKIQHIFVFGHHPFYPLINNFDTHDRQPILQGRIWKPLFVRYGVDAYIHGHDHFYDRSTHDGVAMIDAGGGSTLENPGYKEPQVNFYALFKVASNKPRVEIRALLPGRPSMLYESYALEDLKEGGLKPTNEALEDSYQKLQTYASALPIPTVPSLPLQPDNKTTLLHHFNAAPNVAMDSSSYDNFVPLLPGVKLGKGKFGRACWFDGKSGYLQIRMNKMPDSEGAISMWVNFRQLNSEQVLLTTSRSPTKLLLDLTVSENEPFIRFGLRNQKNKSWNQAQACVKKLATNNWYYIKLTWSSENKRIRIFLDGKLIAKAPLNFVPDLKKTWVWIGSDSDFGNYFNGAIDDLLIKSVSDN